MKLLGGLLADEDILKGIARKGVLGVAPMAMMKQRDADAAEEERQKLIAASMANVPMKNGGTASARADGIAQRGKTRGKMV